MSSIINQPHHYFYLFALRQLQKKKKNPKSLFTLAWLAVNKYMRIVTRFQLLLIVVPYNNNKYDDTRQIGRQNTTIGDEIARCFWLNRTYIRSTRSRVSHMTQQQQEEMEMLWQQSVKVSVIQAIFEAAHCVPKMIIINWFIIAHFNWKRKGFDCDAKWDWVTHWM